VYTLPEDKGNLVSNYINRLVLMKLLLTKNAHCYLRYPYLVLLNVHLCYITSLQSALIYLKQLHRLPEMSRLLDITLALYNWYSHSVFCYKLYMYCYLKELFFKCGKSRVQSPIKDLVIPKRITKLY